MIEILQQYGMSLLYSDGYRFTGLAITLWLLISSVVIGGLLAVPMTTELISNHRVMARPVNR